MQKLWWIYESNASSSSHLKMQTALWLELQDKKRRKQSEDFNEQTWAVTGKSESSEFLTISWPAREAHKPQRYIDKLCSYGSGGRSSGVVRNDIVTNLTTPELFRPLP